MGVGRFVKPSSMRVILVGVALEDDAAGDKDTAGCTADCTADCTASGVVMVVMVVVVVMVMQHHAGRGDSGGGGGDGSGADVCLLLAVLESDKLVEPCDLSGGRGAICMVALGGGRRAHT